MSPFYAYSLELRSPHSCRDHLSNESEIYFAFYAGGHILGQLLVFGVTLCDMIMARCSQYAVRLANELLSWADTRVSSWLSARTKPSQWN
jgi:hypothetical protein